MRNPVLLVVEDDVSNLHALKMALPERWRMMSCMAPDWIPESGFQAALVNVERYGHELVRRLAARGVETIAMSKCLDRARLENALTAGARRFLALPIADKELQHLLAKTEAFLELEARGIWVGGEASRPIRRQIADLVNEDGPILIEGESGTGKEIAAHLIRRPGRPFVVVNVAGLPRNLFESEFFGHVKGAFTGADQNKVGLAEQANGGDLFLDEIEALAPELQAKLLRFLESGEVRRVGARETMKVDARVIVATNRNLHEMVRKREFREDLYYRLNGRQLVLPPLRERRGDIVELAHHFLAQDVRRKTLTDDAMQVLEAHAWLGNVRELKRVCEQIALLAPLPVVRALDVERALRPVTRDHAHDTRFDFAHGLQPLVNAFESRVIENALRQQSDIDHVARLLKISRSSLYKKIKDHGIKGLKLRGPQI